MCSRRMSWLVLSSFVAAACASAGPLLPRATHKLKIVLPNCGEEVRAFNTDPVEWMKFVVNAGFGGGRGAPERWQGWIAKNWMLVDYMDRSGDYPSHGWLAHRGIWYEIYGINEYQETIHFHEEGARKLFWDNGVARDLEGNRVMCPQYNVNVPSWAKRWNWSAYIACNNAPRWSSVLSYDLATCPLLGWALSQDNIGGPTSRTGVGSCARYCDYCNAKFFHYLATTNRLPDFRKRYRHIRDYVKVNLMDLLRQLPPYTRKDRFTETEAQHVARICEDPVMAEYLKFLYLSHLHNFVRYYRYEKIVAKRLGKQFDVHGNMGGGFMGANAYQIALGDFVDTLWYESAGMSTYDIFMHHWNNAWGSFRFEVGRAMRRGRKPLICMTKFRKLEPDLVEHEMAEPCAGGGLLFVKSETFRNRPDLLRLLTDYFTLRHEHRAIFANQRRYCQVALLYSVPTTMYRNFQIAVAAKPTTAMSGAARALKEGHIPFDVVIFNHPEIHPDFVTAEELKRYRLVILP